VEAKLTEQLLTLVYLFEGLGINSQAFTVMANRQSSPGSALV
jgi:hypothetical protein